MMLTMAERADFEDRKDRLSLLLKHTGKRLVDIADDVKRANVADESHLRNRLDIVLEVAGSAEKIQQEAIVFLQAIVDAKPHWRQQEDD